MGPLVTKSDDTRRNIIVGVSIAAVIAAVGYMMWPVEDAVIPVPQQQPVSTVSSTSSVEEVAQEDAKVPEFDLVRISRGGTGVIAGRMAPGAQVELYANGRKISEVTADENGEWVMILEEPLEAGSVELNLKAQETGASEVAEADDVVVVSVPEREDNRFLERSQNGVVAVLTPKDGQGNSTVLQKPGVAAYAEVGESLTLDTIDYGSGGDPVFTGRSLPRVEVRLYLDGRFVGSVRADDSGRWAVPYTNNTLEAGKHIIRLDQTIAEGKVQLRVEQPFETGEPIDASAASGGVLVKPGNTLWQIARQLYGSGFRYTLIFQENSEQILDPDKIYPGQLFKLPNPNKPEN
ncbi:LysM peptidoglycan-binding domain-containing protein [Kordiimonas laminariae]|uniref:LysM peptidoglycan-binding domain-containing protein n=1 Tax=Kordiimonas laminariae TaxID=2917717 RepID=UPI001FF2A574|nr:LysM peptidoglycan-binding domain-containing protein [Kordiimonas laminariae]MCK0069806.1 LysM peptidoglycan-binding domain-containing protein [Kordiimonas laminariae]